ncbi:MAG: 4-hydroxy-tetrahydrodipicolinate reductase [Acidimicrobiales bacterium]
MRVGVVGAGGRMGREVCRTVLTRPGLELVAAIDPVHAGTSISALADPNGPESTGGLTVTADLEDLVTAGAEVVVDFTHLEVSRATLAFCADAGIHAVVGTTGFTEDDLAELGRRFDPESGCRANCVVAANFAIGAVLMMRFAAMAAPWFDNAEIIELHHEAKRDAPSGTSLRTAEAMATTRRAASREEFPPDATDAVVIEGARGGTGPGGIHIHSVRLPGLVAHQEVLLGSPGQGLTIRHDSFDRVSFMDGVVLAVEMVASRPGLTLGLEPLLGI